MARQILTNFDFNGTSRIINLPEPQATHEPATKGYVDSAIEGISWKSSVRVMSQANINLASPGTTIDGVTMVVNDRVLIANQTNAAQNGIYIYNGPSVPLTRSLDGSTAKELEQAIVTVEEGSSGQASYRQTSVNFVLDTDDVLWVSFAKAAGAASESSAGVAEIATQSEVDTGTDNTRIVTPQGLANWVSRPRRYNATIGDGFATQYTITHNFNTRDVTVEVYRNSGNYDTVLVDVDRPSTNSVRITFAVAPANNAFKVVVLA